MANYSEALRVLRKERDDLDEVISRLESLSGSAAPKRATKGKGKGKGKGKRGRKKRGKLSAEARKRISEAMKLRHAARKSEGKTATKGKRGRKKGSGKGKKRASKSKAK